MIRILRQHAFQHADDLSVPGRGWPSGDQRFHGRRSIMASAKKRGGLEIVGEARETSRMASA